jgi:hypothetical protein
VYDNHHFVVQPFPDPPVAITVSTPGIYPQIRNVAASANVLSERVPTHPKCQMPLKAKRTSFTLTIMPHSFVALAEE